MATLILSSNYVNNFYRVTTKKYSLSILHVNKKKTHKIVPGYNK